MAWARSLLTHPAVAAMLLLAALVTRVLVPAGFMPVTTAGGVVLQLCPGTAPAAPEPMAGMHHGGGHSGGHQTPAKVEPPCAFAGLAAPALGSTDPVLLAAALAFVLLLALRAAPVAPFSRPERLRPPLRAPPLPA